MLEVTRDHIKVAVGSPLPGSAGPSRRGTLDVHRLPSTNDLTALAQKVPRLTEVICYMEALV